MTPDSYYSQHGCPFCALSTHDDGVHLVRARNELFVAFNDRKPRATTHIIVATRRHASTLPELALLDRESATNLLPFCVDLTQRLGLDGYKIVVNVGRNGGQRIMHTHAQILSDSR